MQPTTKDRIAKVLGTILGGIMVLLTLGWGVYRLGVAFGWW